MYECFSDSFRISWYNCTQINAKLVQTCDKYHTIECSIGKSDDSLRRATDCVAQRDHALLAMYNDHSHTLKSALHRRICLFVPDTPFVWLMLKLRILECEHLFYSSYRDYYSMFEKCSIFDLVHFAFGTLCTPLQNVSCTSRWDEYFVHFVISCVKRCFLWGKHACNDINN